MKSSGAIVGPLDVFEHHHRRASPVSDPLEEHAPSCEQVVARPRGALLQPEQRAEPGSTQPPLLGVVVGLLHAGS